MNTALQLASLNVNGFKDTQKQRHCFHLIRHLPSTIDLLLLQETHLPQAPQLFRPSPFPSYSFFSATDSGSDGVAIYARRSSFSTTPTFTELIPGRAVAITIQYSESTLHIINLYAPPSPHQQQRHRFFATLQEAIPVQWLQDVFLLAGDFNCVLDADLDRVPLHPPSRRNPDLQLDSLHLLLHSLDLHDPFRHFNPLARKYTCRDVSRIDRWHIHHSLLSHASNLEFHRLSTPSFLTDHLLISLRLQAPDNSNFGPGYWKANHRLFAIPAIHTAIDQILANALSTMPGSPSPFTLWTDIKKQIRTLLRRQGATTAALQRSQQTALIEQIQTLTADIQSLPSSDPTHLSLLLTRHQMEQELAHLTAVQLEGAQVRSRALLLHHHERPTATFCRLERLRMHNRLIGPVYDPQGRLQSSLQDRLTTTAAFYRDLYSPKPSDPRAAHKLLCSTQTNLLPPQADSLLQPFSLGELTVSIQALAPHKAPGPDGLTGAFYQAFHDRLAPLLTMLFNAALTTPGAWPLSFTESVTCLLHKKGAREDLANYRPISLLNTDYKLLTGTINRRLRPFLPQLILPSQTGFMPNRHITDCIHLADLAIHSQSTRRDPLVLLLLDQHKAYDRVSHLWMRRCLTHFHFPPLLTDLILTLHQTASTRILFNGHLTPRIPLRSGVRQGCPLSPTLYNLTLEPLNACIQAQPTSTLCGLRLSSSRLTNTHYADDTLLFAAPQDLAPLNTILRHYMAASGSQINPSKGSIIPLGSWRRGIPPDALARFPALFRSIPIVTATRPTRYLGVPLGPDPRHYIHDWGQASHLLHQLYERWSHRPLSIQGRITVIKTLALSKLWYRAATRPISNTRLDKLFGMPLRQFLWAHKKWHLSTASLYPTPTQGGFALPHLPTKFAQIRLTQLCRLLTRTDPVALQIQELLGRQLPPSCPSLGAALLLPNSSPIRRQIAQRLPMFWSQAFTDSSRIQWTLDPRSLTTIAPWQTIDKIQLLRATPIDILSRLLPQLPPHPDHATYGGTLDLQSPHTSLNTLFHMFQIPWPSDDTATLLAQTDQYSISHVPPGKDFVGLLAVTAPPLPPTLGPAPPPIPLAFPIPPSLLKSLLPPPAPMTAMDTTCWTSEDPRLIPPDQMALALRTWQRLPLDPHTRDLRRKILYFKVPVNQITAQWTPSRNRHPRQPLIPSPACPHCRDPLETPFHALWQCPVAAHVWSMARRILAHPTLTSPPPTPPSPVSWQEALLGAAPEVTGLATLPNTRHPRQPALLTYIRRQYIASLAIATIWALRWSPHLPDNPPLVLAKAQFLRVLHQNLSIACQRPSHPSSPVYHPTTVLGESHPLTLPPPSPPFCIPTLADCPTVYRTLL